MIRVKHELTTGSGYVILEKIIPLDLIDNLFDRLKETYPVRASSSNKKYAEKEEIKNLPDISVWWSQLVHEWPEVLLINDLVYKHVVKYLPSSTLYSSDIVTIEPHTKYVNPHIDTPYRFDEYNYVKRLLGVQAIIPFFDLTENNGATGLVPKSQTLDFNINFCYKGLYNNFFMQNKVQPKLSKGSVLLYNSRVLHSSMPNNQKEKRPALLINYLDNSIIQNVKSLDNLWTSNN